MELPVEKFSEIAAYDGSVIPERTKGEISARCDMEEMNYLALNLADEIGRGERSVEEARRMYAETASAFALGRSSPYVEGLRFEVAHGGTADADGPLIGPMVKGMAEAMTGRGS